MRAASALLSSAAWAPCFVTLCLCATAAAAQPESDFEVPPDPRDQPPRWVSEVHLDGVFALEVEALCDDDVRCVYSGGSGIGGSVERRWPRGLGWFLGYDVWFIDSASVYELGVQQAFRGGLRYTANNAGMVHPLLEVGAGLSTFGDTFLVDSFGVILQGMLGIEFELSRFFGVLGGMGVRAFSHTAFTTERDQVSRGDGRGFSEVLFVQVRLAIHGRPWASAEP